MDQSQVELVTFEDEFGEEESFLILDRIQWQGATYAFMLEMEDEHKVLQEDGKPVFLVMREAKGDYYDLTKEESERITSTIQQNWKSLNKKIQELEGYAT